VNPKWAITDFTLILGAIATTVAALVWQIRKKQNRAFDLLPIIALIFLLCLIIVFAYPVFLGSR